MTRAMVEPGWSHGGRWRCSPNVQRIIEAGAAPRLSGSGALGLADVAAGRIDAYVELHINLWDVAAALVLLHEAGAHVSPFLDGDGPERGNPILACAPGLADELTRIAGF